MSEQVTASINPITGQVEITTSTAEKTTQKSWLARLWRARSRDMAARGRDSVHAGMEAMAGGSFVAGLLHAVAAAKYFKVAKDLEDAARKLEGGS